MVGPPPRQMLHFVQHDNRGLASCGESLNQDSRLDSVKLVVTVDRDEDGVYVIECPSIPGCVSQGGIEEEALRNIQDAIKECLEVRAERGMSLTNPMATA